MINCHGVVHVRGTPASGKTTLARHLAQRLKNTHRVVFIESWGITPLSTTAYLVSRAHGAGYLDVTEDEFFGHRHNNLVFIIDEAQVTYVDSLLWYTAIKTRIGIVSGPGFCLFSSYGSPSTGAPSFNYPATTTPPILRKEQRVSLTIPAGSQMPTISLFYTTSEFEDVIVRFCRQPSVEFTLAEDLQNHLYSLTDGHPGVVHAVLTFIQSVYRTRFKRTEIRRLTLDHIRGDLDDDEKLIEYVKLAPAGRGFPSRDLLQQSADPKIIAVFLDILYNGSRKPRGEYKDELKRARSDSQDGQDDQNEQGDPDD
ncbi:hypothetical protein TSTA_121560 [Paecilomyces variotii No. 5]|uniref:AAA+ ATPase domain-containing protein n=1 Tax=Byssochlamys spectabilis (strain No. 5 / NBRC 109023) TaxID=1356009 RepID=V5FDM1_BYSSN|nr:hypothetical protein TSTA_121560 [Paecilomyces variotii No. 5]